MDVSLIRDLVAIAGVLIALTYYIVNIRYQRKPRQTQLFMDLYKTYRDPAFRTMYNEILTQEWNDFEDCARMFNSHHINGFCTQTE